MQPQTFDNISREQFQAFVERAQDPIDGPGLVINADSGDSSRNGYHVSWKYDQASQSLTIQCLHKPRPLPEELIDQAIEDLVDGTDSINARYHSEAKAKSQQDEPEEKEDPGESKPGDPNSAETASAGTETK